MTKPKSEVLGVTVSEYLSKATWALDHDEGVGMWEMVPAAGYFGLAGKARVDFIRRYIHLLLDHGAIAVKPGVNNKKGWTQIFILGETPDGIANAVIADWLEAGGGDPPWEGVWFKLPGTFKMAES